MMIEDELDQEEFKPKYAKGGQDNLGRVFNKLKNKNFESRKETKEDNTLDFEKHKALNLLHEEDIWSEDLLSLLFDFTVKNVLHPRERFVLEMKVEGKSDKYIINVMKQKSPQRSFTLETLKVMKSKIKKKLKDGFNQSIPGWVKQKVRDEEKDKISKFYEEHPEYLGDEE